MKRFVLPIPVGKVKFVLEILEYFLQGTMDSLAALAINIKGDTNPYIMRGCVVTRTGTAGNYTYNWTSGAIFFNGEIYQVAAGTLNATGDATWAISETLTSLPFKNNTSQNVLTDRKITLTASGGTVGAWNAVQALTFATVAKTGNYSDLTNKPSLFSGSYSDLTNKPSLFSGSYNDLSNKPSLFDGNYENLSNKPIGGFVRSTTSNIYASKDNNPQSAWVDVTLDNSFTPVNDLVTIKIGNLLEGSWRVSNGNWQFAGATGPGDIYKAIAILLPENVITDYNFSGSCDYAYGDNAANNALDFPPNGQAFWRVGQITVGGQTKNVLIIYRPVDSMVGQGDRFTIQCNFKAALS